MMPCSFVAVVMYFIWSPLIAVHLLLIELPCLNKGAFFLFKTELTLRFIK